MHGYYSQAYASSFRDYGSPLRLEAAEGWALERPIPGTDDSDAMGLYPLLACRNWRGLKADLDLLAGRLVSIVAVPDPFGDFDTSLLSAAFGDVVRPFKPHFVIDASKPMTISRHHRYYARRSAKTVEVKCIAIPADAADAFYGAYCHLVAHHALSSFKALSPAALTAQLGVPGALLFLASRNGESLGGQVWYTCGEVAYNHLTALTREGYRHCGAYALYAAAIDTLRVRVRWLDLGGAAGLQRDDGDGLAVFKRGWANDERMSFLCGRILNRRRYAILTAQCLANGFFPAYRAPDQTQRAAPQPSGPSTARV